MLRRKRKKSRTDSDESKSGPFAVTVINLCTGWKIEFSDLTYERNQTMWNIIRKELAKRVKTKNYANLVDMVKQGFKVTFLQSAFTSRKGAGASKTRTAQADGR